MRHAPRPAIPNAPTNQSTSIDPHLLGYLDCFNAGRYFEAHEVLEALWLPRRGKPDADFLKGLIQLAGAFVHLQKSRPSPALSLLRLAQANLARPTPGWDCLPRPSLMALIDAWQTLVTREGAASMASHPPPRIDYDDSAAHS